MALTLESIYRPLNDFFLNRFHFEDGGQLLFRFDKFGSVLSDDDFIDDHRPELGYLPALAEEKFSDLVNHIPIDTGDGTSIVLSEALIDSAYFYRLLSPSLPYVPAGADEASKQGIIDSFSLLKTDCLKVWNSIKLESASGLMLQYKPALATPEDWYDRSRNESWTHQSFDVAAAPAPPEPEPATQLWKLRPNDATMARVLELPEPATVGVGALPPRVDVTGRVLQLRAPRLGTLPDPVEPAPAAVSLAEVGLDSPHLAGDVLHRAYLRQFRELDVSRRILVKQYIDDNAPTEPVGTDSISISFDYCLVRIRRPWYRDVFVNQRSWWVPTVRRGELSLSGPPGNLALLPIGFVAVRSLSIEADWAGDDLANAAVATNFGPFKVDAGVVGGKLTHQGLQVAGWLLERMPELPPNDAPAAPPS
jgi:hypothetical protein